MFVSETQKESTVRACLDAPDARPGSEALFEHCVICGHARNEEPASQFGSARGNTARFSGSSFPLWKCSRCETIHSYQAVDLADIYRDYPLNLSRRLDAFARGTLGNLLRRLKRVGLQKHHTLLDFGCGSGAFLQFLEQRGYRHARGYDPYVPAFSELPAPPELYDVVVANDVLEHCENPKALMRECLSLLKPGGVLYMGTADSAGVSSMKSLDPHLMRLHQPFHRILVNQSVLRGLGRQFGLQELQHFRRSYMDTFVPAANYRVLDELSRAVEHNMDRMLDPSAAMVFARTPRLWLFALVGYFFPTAYEPACIWRKPEGAQ